MGGELDKKTLQNPEEEMLKNGKTQGKNHKNKHLQNDTEIKARASQTNIKGVHKRNDAKKKKKDKVSIVAKDKESNEEKKVLELIHEKNPEKEDYEMLYDIISKHFFLQTLNHQAKDEIIISMSLYSIKEGKTLYSQGSHG